MTIRQRQLLPDALSESDTGFPASYPSDPITGSARSILSGGERAGERARGARGNGLLSRERGRLVSVLATLVLPYTGPRPDQPGVTLLWAGPGVWCEIASNSTPTQWRPLSAR